MLLRTGHIIVIIAATTAVVVVMVGVTVTTARRSAVVSVVFQGKGRHPGVGGHVRGWFGW